MKLPIPADWDGESWCRWAICWPDSERWEAILRGFVTLPQRGRTWDERTGSILDVQETGREITAANLPFSGVLMACNDTELTQAFSDIALAIRYLADKQCCDNLQIDVQGGFQGTITQGSGEVIPIYGSEPPIGLEPGAFPETYADRETYDADKCLLANQIIDGLTSTLTNMAAFGTYNALTLAVLIAVSMATTILFPPAMIPVAISVLLILTGSLFLIAQLNAAIIADRAGWVCWLYEGENTEAIMSVLADALDAILVLIPVGGKLAWGLKTLVLVLLNSNTLNQLFAGSPVAPGGEVDCSGCACEETREFLFEEDTEEWTEAGITCSGLPSNGSTSLSHVEDYMLLTASGGSGDLNAVIARSPELSLTLSTSHRVRLSIHSNTNDMAIILEAELLTGGCITRPQLDLEASASAEIELSLSGYAGDTLERVTVYANSSIGEPIAAAVFHVVVDCPG